MWSFGRFTRRLRRLVCQGGNRSSKEHTLEQGDVLVDRLACELEGRGELGHVDELSRVAGRQSEQLGKRVERTDAGEVPDVTSDLGLDIVSIPGAPPGGATPCQSGRVAASHDPLGQLGPKRLSDARPETGSEQCLEEPGRSVLDLTLG
jgi:hypothetical protein